MTEVTEDPCLVVWCIPSSHRDRPLGLETTSRSEEPINHRAARSARMSGASRRRDRLRSQGGDQLGNRDQVRVVAE